MKWIQSNDVNKLTDALARAYKAEYRAGDRHADFVQLFRGSDQGLRVLHQILEWGNIWGSTIPRHQGSVDVNQVIINEGERRLALKILSTVNVEPPQNAPSRATHTETKDG